jgi:hypothetical protein
MKDKKISDFNKARGEKHLTNKKNETGKKEKIETVR